MNSCVCVLYQVQQRRFPIGVNPSVFTDGVYTKHEWVLFCLSCCRFSSAVFLNGSLFTDGLYTKGTRAHIQKELIRGGAELASEGQGPTWGIRIWIFLGEAQMEYNIMFPRIFNDIPFNTILFSPF